MARFPSSSGVALPEGGRCKIPCDWSQSLGADFRGRVLFERSFNWPARLEAGQLVELVIDSLQGNAQVTLNGQSLGSCNTTTVPWRAAVSALLEPHNRLEIVVEHPSANQVSSDASPLAAAGNSAAGGLTGEIRLEIYPPA